MSICDYLINFSMANDDITGRLPLERKLYQLIIGRIDGKDIQLPSYREKILSLVKRGICGFIIFGGGKDEVRKFIGILQSNAEIPLFIASDIERGVGQQILGYTLFPCQMAMAAAIDKNKPMEVSILRSAIKAIAAEAIETGINMPLMPVLDINSNPDNPIICTRAFSDEPDEVAWFGSEYIKALEGTGLISCAKHFPGHGDTSTDSHILLPVINKSYAGLMDVEVAPFIKAIDIGISSIMIGHLSIPSIDDKPASLSKNIISRLLKEELGFNGLVLTDALNMHALKDIENVPAQCINAGADVLLHPLDPVSSAQELMSAVESKKISEKRIDEALDRILKAKKKLQHIERPWINHQKHQVLSLQIIEMSITLLKNTPGILPVSDKKNIELILAGDSEFFRTSPLRDHFNNCSLISDSIEMKDKTSLFALFTKVAAWKGSSGIDENDKARIQELIRKAGHSIVVSFGSPYVLRHFQGADILIAAYEPTEQAQNAVLKCLEGQLIFKGRLPVRINW